MNKIIPDDQNIQNIDNNIFNKIITNQETTFPKPGYSIRSVVSNRGNKSSAKVISCNSYNEERKNKNFIPKEIQIKTAYYFLNFTSCLPHLRGLLLFHKVGSGKTCTSIIIADLLLHLFYSSSTIPDKLKQSIPEAYKSKIKEQQLKNLIREPEKCFKADKIIVISKSGLIKQYMLEYCRTCGINTELFRHLFYFISHTYHGKELGERYKIGIKPTTNPLSIGEGEISFENSLIIFDEIHTFIHSVSNAVSTSNKKKQQDKNRTVLLLYNKINNTRNCKLLGLTGTPVYKGIGSLPILINLFKRRQKYSTDLKENPDTPYNPRDDPYFHNIPFKSIKWGTENKQKWVYENGTWKEYIDIQQDIKGYTVDENGIIQLHTLNEYDGKNNLDEPYIKDSVKEYKKQINDENISLEELIINPKYKKIKINNDEKLKEWFNDWISFFDASESEINRKSFPKIISGKDYLIKCQMSRNHFLNYTNELEKEERLRKPFDTKEPVRDDENNATKIRANLREFSLIASNFYYPKYTDENNNTIDIKYSYNKCDLLHNEYELTVVEPFNWKGLDNKILDKEWERFKKRWIDFKDENKPKWKDKKEEWFNKRYNEITQAKYIDKKGETSFEKWKKQEIKSMDIENNELEEVDNQNDEKVKKVLCLKLMLRIPEFLDEKMKDTENDKKVSFKIKKRVNGWIGKDFFTNEIKEGEEEKNILNYSSKLFAMFLNIINNPYQKHIIFTQFIIKSGVKLIISLFKYIINCLIERENKKVEEDNDYKFNPIIKFWIGNDGKCKNILKYTGEEGEKYLNKQYNKDEHRNLFNNPNNDYGQFYPIMILSEAGMTGIDLHCVRHEHFFNQHPVPTTKQQAIGRGARFNSHKRLKENEKNITIWEYFSVNTLNEDVPISKTGIDGELYVDYQQQIRNLTYFYNLIRPYDVNHIVDILNDDYQQFKTSLLNYYSK